MKFDEAMVILRITHRSCLSIEDVKKAYRLRMKEVHPDLGGDTKDAQIVNEAFECLKKFLGDKDEVFLGFVTPKKESLGSVDIKSYLDLEKMGESLKVDLKDSLVFFVDGKEIDRKLIVIPFSFGLSGINKTFNLSISKSNTNVEIKTVDGLSLLNKTVIYLPFQRFQLRIGRSELDLTINWIINE